MIINIPESVIISEPEITQNTPQWRTTSMSKRTQIRDRGIHYLTGSVTLTSAGYDGAMYLETLVLRLRGGLHQLELDLGGRFTASNVKTCRTVAPVPINTTQFRVDTLTSAGVSPVTIKAGNTFNIPNDSKLYYVMDYDTASRQLEVYPSIRIALPEDSIINFANTKILVTIDETSQTVKYTEGGLISEITLAWTEFL